MSLNSPMYDYMQEKNIRKQCDACGDRKHIEDMLYYFGTGWVCRKCLNNFE